MIEIEIYEPSQENLTSHPTPLLKKVKFFIYCAIVIKFETQHFHMFTKTNWNRNLWMETPYPPGAPPSIPLKKVKFFIYFVIFTKFET